MLCIGVAAVLCLIYEGVYHEYVVCSSSAFCEGTLEGEGYVCIFHEVHKAGVEDSR